MKRYRYGTYCFLKIKSYRIAMPVTEVRVINGDDEYPVCPRCQITVEREYQKFCDRCGQRLDWKNLSEATVCEV